MKNILCKIGIHKYKCFNPQLRRKEITTLFVKFHACELPIPAFLVDKKCERCGKEITEGLDICDNPTNLTWIDEENNEYLIDDGNNEWHKFYYEEEYDNPLKAKIWIVK